jgi:transposase-like protein
MERKIITAETKAEILRELLENQVSAADLSERYGVNVNSIYGWRKQLFEAAADIFSAKRERASQKEQAATARLEEQLRQKDTLIAELVQDNIVLKKKSNGMR